MEISSKDSARLDELGTLSVRWAAALSERATERNEETEGGFVGGSAGGIILYYKVFLVPVVNRNFIFLFSISARHSSSCPTSTPSPVRTEPPPTAILTLPVDFCLIPMGTHEPSVR